MSKILKFEFRDGLYTVEAPAPEFGQGHELPATGPYGRNRYGKLFSYVTSDKVVTLTWAFKNVELATLGSILTKWKTYYSYQVVVSMIEDGVTHYMYKGQLITPILDYVINRDGTVNFQLRFSGTVYVPESPR